MAEAFKAIVFLALLEVLVCLGSLLIRFCG